MDLATARRALPIVYGAIVAILWVTVKGTVATTFTVVGGIVLGALFALDQLGGDDERKRERAQRDRDRDRRRNR